jgi:hypothetical protein
MVGPVASGAAPTGCAPIVGDTVPPLPYFSLAHCEPGYPARGRSLAGELLAPLVAASRSESRYASR